VGLPHSLYLSSSIYPFILSWDVCVCMNIKSMIFVVIKNHRAKSTYPDATPTSFFFKDENKGERLAV